MIFVDAQNNGNLLDHLKDKAGKVTYGSFLYNWSLGGSMPNAFSVNLSEPWQGDQERGRKMLGSQLDMRSPSRVRRKRDFDYSETGNISGLTEYIHSFVWLRDLRSLGGDEARAYAREMISEWISTNSKWDEALWRPQLTAKRVSMWISMYSFFGSSAGEDFQHEFMESLVRQARHICRSWNMVGNDIGAFYVAKAMFYAGLSIPGFDPVLDHAQRLLEKETEEQILSDGVHRSRNPEAILEILQIYVDIRSALAAAGYEQDDFIQQAIDSMCAAIRFFRSSNKMLPLFNGSTKGDLSLAESLILQARAKGKSIKTLESSGFERVSIGKSVLLVDCGRPPERPYDFNYHVAPLAFEFSHGRDRIFVNCGTHKMSEEWRQVLRGTAAHNTLCMDNRNAMEILENGHLGRSVRKICCDRQETHGSCLLDMCHDGYVSLNGTIHRRRLFLEENGTRLLGEESLTCTTGKYSSRKIRGENDAGSSGNIALRFHLHPRTSVSLISDGTEALIRTPSGYGWRFKQSGGYLALEESIYVGDGINAAKTTQIVVHSRMEDDFLKIKWLMNREG